MKIALPFLVGVLAIAAGSGTSAGAGGKAAAKPAATKPALGGKRVVKAGGDARAWTTLRPLLPAGVTVAGQVNVAALRSSETFKQVRRLFEKDHDFKDIHDTMKSGCQIDLGEAVQDVAFAVSGPNDAKVLLALSFRGVGEAELLHCGEVLLAKKGGGAARTIESKHVGTGPIVEYTVSSEKDHLYAAWLAPDVVAFVVDGKDRSQLEHMIGGKGSLAGAAPTRRALAAVVPGAVAWGVYLESEQLDAHELKLAAGSLSVSGGQLSVDIAMIMADADTAKRAAAEWIVQRDRLASGAGGVPVPFANLAKTVQIVASDDVVRITASVAEKDFAGFFSMF